MDRKSPRLRDAMAAPAVELVRPPPRVVAGPVEPAPAPTPRKSPRLCEVLGQPPEPVEHEGRAPRKPAPAKPEPAAAQPRRPRMPEDVPDRGTRPGFGQPKP